MDATPQQGPLPDSTRCPAIPGEPQGCSLIRDLRLKSTLIPTKKQQCICVLRTQPRQEVVLPTTELSISFWGHSLVLGGPEPGLC